MFYNLNDMARLRQREIELQAEGRRQKAQTRVVHTRWVRRGRISRIMGSALVRVGAGMQNVGRDLECREVRIVAELPAAG